MTSSLILAGVWTADILKLFTAALHISLHTYWQCMAMVTKQEQGNLAKCGINEVNKRKCTDFFSMPSLAMLVSNEMGR